MIDHYLIAARLRTGRCFGWTVEREIEMLARDISLASINHLSQSIMQILSRNYITFARIGGPDPLAVCMFQVRAEMSSLAKKYAGRLNLKPVLYIV